MFTSMIQYIIKCVISIFTNNLGKSISIKECRFGILNITAKLKKYLYKVIILLCVARVLNYLYQEILIEHK